MNFLQWINNHYIGLVLPALVIIGLIARKILKNRHYNLTTIDFEGAVEIPPMDSSIKTCRNCRYSITDGGRMGCLKCNDLGAFGEIAFIKNALETHQCPEFKSNQDNNKPICPDCKDSDGNVVYPQYGVGPHKCFYKIEGAVLGDSELLPKDLWPDNFIEDPDCKECGVWFCPTCKEGMTEHRELISKGIPTKTLWRWLH